MSYARKIRVLALFFFILTIAFTSSAFSQNLVTNGGFEDGAQAPANGWTTHNANTTFNGWTVGPANSVDVHNGEGGAGGFTWNRPLQGGYQSLDLNGNDASSVSQLLPTGTGKYKLSFYMAGNLACGPSPKVLQVSLGGQVLPNVSYSSGGNSSTMIWELHEYELDLTGPSTLTFSSLTSGGCGPAIDNVWVSKVPTALGRTSWQMYRNPIVSPVTSHEFDSPSHGNIGYYDFAPAIPAVDANVPLSGVNGGWTAAPNGSTIGFGNGNASRLTKCWVQADFTFFQTLVDIPSGTTNFTFSIAFSGMDDGSRVSIFNSKYPLGLVVAGSYVFLGGTGTSDLAPYVVVGETNRVVITQVDDCPVGNNLQSATVNLNGTVIPPNTPPSVSATSTSLTVNEGVTATNSGSFSDSNTGDNVTITASVGTVTKIGTNSGTWSWSNPAPDGLNVSSVTITANDGHGGTATATFSVTVNNVAPTATFNAPPSVNLGSSFTLSLSAPQDVPADSPTLQYAFDCDDGNGFNALSGSSSRNCAATGTQLVRAAKGTIQDKDAGKTTYSATVNIVPPPLVSAGGSYNVNEGASITLSGSCNSCVSFAWDLNNDGVFDDSTSATPPFSAATLDGPSTQTVKFRGTGSTGLTSDATATVNVLNVAPVLGTGKVVANNDEWTFTDTGFNQNQASATQFIKNVANYFTGGHPGKFLAYSTNFGLTGTPLANAITGAGHTWTVSTAVPFTLSTLLNYDGVFLSADVNGIAPNNQVLIDYVRAGGNVYVAGGTGCCGGPGGEAGTWNTFLGTFGLRFDTNQYNGIRGNIAPVSAHPLLANVSTLYFDNGNSVSVTNPAIAQILFSTNGQGMLGVAAIGSVSANSIAEGQSTTLSATFADPGIPDTHVVTLNWGDGQTSTLNLAANVLSFNASHQYNDNAASFTIDITVTDKDGGTVTKSTAIQVTNVAPTATLNAPAVVNAGANFTISLTNSSDPSTVDTLAGFKYAFDCGTGYGALGSSNSGNCTAPGSGPVTVKGKIQDKDDGFTEYTRSVNINRAPVCTDMAIVLTEDSGPDSRVLTCSDPDQGDSFTLELVSVNLPGASASGTITLTPGSNVNGAAGTFQFRARDSGGVFSNTASAVVFVNPVNDAPVVTAPAAATIPEGDTVSIGLDAQVTDVETIDANIQWTASATGAVSASIDPATRTLVLTAAEGPASGVVTLNATDRGDPDGCSGPTPGCSPAITRTVTFNVTITVPTTPTFSVTAAQPPPGACICTPEVMNTNSTGVEHWWVKADNSGNLTLKVSAHSVNAIDPETVIARIYPASGAGPALATITASYAAGTVAGTEVVSLPGSIATIPGAVYLVRITTPGTPPTQPHYSLKFTGASEAAVKSPTFTSFENHKDVRWFFNLSGPENLAIRVFTQGTPDALATTNPLSADVRLLTEAGAIINDWAAFTVPNPVGGATLDTTFTQSVTGPGRVAFNIQGTNMHYRIERLTGADRDVYLTWQTFGNGSVSGSINNGGGLPSTTPVQVNLKSLPSGTIVASLPAAVGSYNFPNVPVGSYRVEIVPPAGSTVLGPSAIDIFVVCDEEAAANFKFILGSTLTLAPASGTYGGNTTLQATLTSSGSPLINQSVTFTLNGSPVGSAVTNGGGVATLSNVSLAGINAGPYLNAAAASFAGDINYQSSSTTANLTVAPAPLTITANPQTKVYGAADPALTYLASGFQFADTAAIVLTGTLTRAPGEAVADGPYAITKGTLGSNTNYTINFTGSSLNITPRELTVNANAQTKVYGAADPALTYLASGFQFADTAATVLTGTLTRAPGEAVADGPYAITKGTLGSNTNYTINFTGSSLKITPRELTITADPQTKVYGVTDPDLTYQASGFQFSDTGATVLTGGLARAAGETVGSYTIERGSLASNNNYTISFNVSSLNITPRGLTVTADPQTKVYGDADPTLTYVASGFQFSDTAATVLTGTLKRAPGETVAGSTYAITQGTLAANSNYTINFTGDALAITPRTLSVAAQHQAKVYGTADPTLSYLASGFQLTDTAATVLTGTLSRVAGETVPGSPYGITQGTLVANSNYAISFSGEELVITPATPTITWANPVTILYGTALSGTQLNATETTSLPGTFVYTPAAGTVLSVGSGQTLSVSFAPDDNLNYTTASGSVLINVVEAKFSATTPVNEGGSITLSLSNPIDSLGGFTYAFDCGTGFGVFGSSTTAACAAPDNETRTVNGKIRAADGSITNYSASVTINNVAPVVITLAPSATSISENGSVTLAGTFTDPGVLDTHSVIINWGDGSPNTELALGANVLGFSATHQYLDDDPTGTSSDLKTIAVTVTDKDGGSGAGSTNVTVNNLAPVITGVTGPVNPLSVGVSTGVTVNFTDAGSLDSHTCAFSWGDGATSTVSTAGEGSCADNHVYSTAGVYTVNITLTDDDTGVATTQYQYAVVYDAGAGFVTGGGWINSPAGAYAANPSLAGRANFGFVSKYLRGATAPTGQTEFQFKVGNLNFHSTSYEWLVIAGARAQYKGSGTINGSGDYFFLLTAIDGQINGGGGIDKFRIKIWNKTTGGVIYDNQAGAGDQDDPSTGLSGGSIVIHTN
jgi:hypothetical protein